MLLPGKEQQQEEKTCEKQVSAVNEAFEDADHDWEIEAKAQCYDCVEPDLFANGFANAPNFGSIAIADSSNCHFGNKTYYQGPVTVLKQIVVPSLREKPIEAPEPSVAKAEVPPAKDANKKCIEKVCHLDLCRGPTRRRVIAAGITAVITGLIATFVYLIIATTHLANKSRHPSNGDGSLGDTGDGTVSGSTPTLDVDTLRMWDRSSWLAQPPVDVLDNLTLPVHYVVIIHSATENCFTTADCIGRVRYIQQFHIETRKWSDISYNYLVGGEGAVYEGRGWDKVGAHTLGWNSKSIGICAVGTFTTLDPTPKQVSTVQKLIARGVALGKIARDYKLLAHSQLLSTESPGRRFFTIIQKWPHWYNGTEG